MLGDDIRPSLRKTPRLGNSRKAGDLKRLAGACINGGVCGLIRQYTGNLTNRSYIPSTAFYMHVQMVYTEALHGCRQFVL